MEEKKPLRILVSAPLGIGGVSNLMLNIQERIDRDKINFDYLVVHNRKEPQEDRALRLGSKKIVACADQFRFRPLRAFVRLFEIYKVCRENHVKILHYNSGASMGILVVMAAKAGGVKYITYHSHNGGMSNEGALAKPISRLCKPFIPMIVDDMWACSTVAAQFTFPKAVTQKGQFYFMPNAIDLEKYEYNKQVREEVRKELGIQGKFVIGHAGRFNHQKNHLFLIDIFHKVKDKEKDAVLLLIGVGELMETVKEKVNNLHLANDVIFYGASNEMERMYQAMDVFLMPSKFEGLPVTGVEAQAAGLPIIFSDVITKEVAVCDYVNYISLDEKPDRWANAVLDYKNCIRESQCEKLRKAGFDEWDMVNHFQTYYLEVGRKLGLC